MFLLSRNPWWHAALLASTFSLIYLPGVGRGFIKDDFAWITYGQVTDLDSIGGVLFGNVGFYRPIVSLSFGLNHALFSMASLGFGVTNFALALACGGAIYALARALQLSSAGALLAAGLWAFNFHGINMAILWLSGRTSLLLTLFSVLAAIAMLGRRPTWTFLCTLLALGSKEEAVALPFVFALWQIEPWRQRAGELHLQRAVQGLRATWPSWLALAAYLVARSQSGAFNPESAPSYYRFTFDIAAVLKNIAEYADRSMTFSALAIVLLGLALRVRPEWTTVNRDVIGRGWVWLLAGFALTVWLPVRSSLYAVFPSVGVVLIAAALAESMTSRAAAHRLRIVVIVALLLPIVLWPIYRARNVRWIELADLSSATTAAIAQESGSIAVGTVIELRDDRADRANFGTAFGTLYPEASRLLFGDRYHLWIEPPTPEQVEAGLQRPQLDTGARFQLDKGRVRRVD